MNKKIWLVIGILAVVGIGWYFSSGAGLKGSFYDPSSRKIDLEKQASSQTLYKTRETKNTPPPTSAAPYVGKYYFTDEDTTIGEIYNGTGAWVIAYYDNGYMLYPTTGPYYNAKKASWSQKIPKNRGIVIIRENESKILFSNLLRPATAKPTEATTTAPLSDYESGWVLVASKEEKLSDYIAPFKDRVASVWAIQNGDKFGKVDKVDMENFLFEKYSMAWVKLVKKGESTSGVAGDMAPNIIIDPKSFMPKQSRP